MINQKFIFVLESGIMEFKLHRKIPHFFSYKVNRRILSAFFLIITIPILVSFGVTNFLVKKTMQKEIRTRLNEGLTVYFRELETIEKKCMDIATGYSAKPTIIEQMKEKNYAALEEDMIGFYQMNLIDIIEIEDTEGRVIFRGHNPVLAGDIKSNQQVVKDGLAGKAGFSYEEGHSGVAVRATAPIFSEGRVMGIFMAGSLFSQDYVSRLKSLTLLANGIYRADRKIISTYSGMEKLEGEFLERLKAGETLIRFNQKFGDETYHVIARPIFMGKDYWGAVLLGIDRKEAEKAYQYTNDLLTILLLLGIFIAILIYYFLARNINSSLQKIITGISNFSFDNPNLPIDMRRSDEFKIIADNYNLLIERLELYKQRITRLQNDLVGSTRLATAGQVAAGLAHEIRNPLSSIKMMAQIIDSRFLEKGTGEEEMQIILGEIDRINTRVTELLEFARPGKMDFLYHDIHKIINGVVNLCAYEIRQKEIELRTDFDRSIPEIYADGEKLRICILNIVLNAVQAMEKGKLLTLSTRIHNEQVLIEICNSGSRIESTRGETLFDPFFTTREGGTGLGLSITKMIIERHGGTVEVRKQKEMVCFSINIPLNHNKEEE